MLMEYERDHLAWTSVWCMVESFGYEVHFTDALMVTHMNKINLQNAINIIITLYLAS